MLRKYILLLFAVIGLVSCKKDQDFGPQFLNGTGKPPETIGAFNQTVYVVNEGNFGFGNASITEISYEGQLVNSKFKNVSRKALGDVAQSMLIVHDTAFIIVNASETIFKVQLPAFNILEEKKVQGSPRYMLRIDDNKYLLTNLGKRQISILDNRLREIGQIDVSGWTEELTMDSNFIYACQVRQNNVLVIDRSSLAIVTEIQVGKQPQSIQIDRDGIVWVLCDGGFDKNDRELASIYKIDPNTKKAWLAYTFPDISMSPSRLRMNEDGSHLYFLNKSVWRFTSHETKIEPNEIIRAEESSYYGLNISKDGMIWVTDAKNFVDQGRILSFDSSGEKNSEYATGIIPQHIEFYYH